jgi:hypothetical protein
MYSILDNIKSNDKGELIFIDNNNRIVTADQAADIILSWNTADIPVEIFVKIENILQKLQSDNINENLFINEEVVISALNVKIIERENLLHPKKSNKEAFNDMISTNDDVREKMNFIETKSGDGKEIDYISLRNDDNTVDVLVCRTDTEIQDYIKKHGDEIPSRSAKEIFYDMNNMFRVPLNFQRLSEDNTDIKLSKAEEKQKVRDAVKSFGLEGHIYVAVDCFGERIYKIADGIFKFDYNQDGTIEFLQEPKNMRSLNKQQEKAPTTFLDTMLSAVQSNNESMEPEDEYQELEAIDAYEEDHKENGGEFIPNEGVVEPTFEDEPEIVEEAQEVGISDDKFDEEENTKFVKFDSNKFNQLLKKAYANDLTKKDIHLLATYIYLLSNDRTPENIESDPQKRLDQYFYNYMYDDYDRANNVKKERIPEVMDLELYNALQYFENKEDEMLPKKKEEVTYEEEPIKLRKTNGVALIIIIVEIIVVALFIAMIFSLDI